MTQTALLPPFTALRLAWALTGKFSKESAASQEIAVLAEKVIKDIQEQAQRMAGPEQQYINGAVFALEASQRTLDTIYKGRELNIQENNQLRSVSMENIKDNLEFGKKAQDFLKSWPTMTVTTGAGLVTTAQLVHLTAWQLLLVGLGLAGIGYFINLWIVRLMRRRQEELYIAQDYDRNLYFEDYVTKVRTALVSLYLDLDRIHYNAFGQTYPISPPQEVAEIVEEIVKGLRGNLCRYIHKHKMEKKITPELWPRCETGGTSAQHCPLWEGPPPS